MIRNSELLGGLFWLAVGAFIIWAGRDMGLGSLHEPRRGNRDAVSTGVACSHLEQVAILDPPAEVAGCEECLCFLGEVVFLVRPE